MELNFWHSSKSSKLNLFESAFPRGKRRASWTVWISNKPGRKKSTVARLIGKFLVWSHPAILSSSSKLFINLTARSIDSRERRVSLNFKSGNLKQNKIINKTRI